MKFKLGMTVMTRGFADMFESREEAEKVGSFFIRKHMMGDYGELEEGDIQANEEAIEHGDRILSAYQYNDEKLYVITEADRSSTTILLADEY